MLPAAISAAQSRKCEVVVRYPPSLSGRDDEANPQSPPLPISTSVHSPKVNGATVRAALGRRLTDWLSRCSQWNGGAQGAETFHLLQKT